MDLLTLFKNKVYMLALEEKQKPFWYFIFFTFLQPNGVYS